MLLRLLWGLAAICLTVVAVFESVTRGWMVGGVVFAFALLPDAALVGAFDPMRRGMLRPDRVRLYNILHLARFPVVLIALGSLVQLPAVAGVPGGALIAAAGIAWLAHIAADRALGFGLRDAEGGIRTASFVSAPGVCRT